MFHSALLGSHLPGVKTKPTLSHLRSDWSRSRGARARVGETASSRRDKRLRAPRPDRRLASSSRTDKTDKRAPKERKRLGGDEGGAGRGLVEGMGEGGAEEGGEGSKSQARIPNQAAGFTREHASAERWRPISVAMVPSHQPSWPVGCGGSVSKLFFDGSSHASSPWRRQCSSRTGGHLDPNPPQLPLQLVAMIN